jgi:hypothetical protein
VKHFWFLFSIYILLLSVLPCGDIEDCQHKASNTVSNFQSSNTDHQNHHHNAEHCSPFCTCSCCSIACSVFEIQKLQFRKISIHHSELKIALRNDFTLYHFLENIWQPPKILT